jgi:tRNA modification GTPase
VARQPGGRGRSRQAALLIPNDTIAAIATAPGRGAVGVIRVSGPDVPRIAAVLLGALPPARHATLSSFRDEGGATLDLGLALYFPAPASFTGEAVLELQGHGGALVLDLVLQRLLLLGCRVARPGEFSERAFLNGKLDMAQAEAVADLIDAGSTAAARAAVRSLQGEFSALIRGLQERLTALRMLVEAAIDFPDEEVDFLSDAELRRQLGSIAASFAAIRAGARQGVLLREGLTVVIAGKPNAGKSSLLNRLTGSDTAIVTAVPGTTRDVLRQQIDLHGMPLNMVDTAGLRDSTDPVEAEGVRRARAELARADHVLYVCDAAEAAAGAPLESDPALTAATVPVTRVWNKIDLVTGPQAAALGRIDPAAVAVSALTGAGLEALRARLKEAAGFEVNEAGAFIARRRHLDALARAEQQVTRAATALQTRRAYELFAEDLRLAQAALGEITGEFSSDDLLGEIFSSFCIGK